MGKVGPHWLAVVYLLNTLGELCLSPIGLSLVNKLAPARVASLMMAVWFLSTAIANYLAGKLEELLEALHRRPLDVPDLHVDRARRGPAGPDAGPEEDGARPDLNREAMGIPT